MRASILNTNYGATSKLRCNFRKGRSLSEKREGKEAREEGSRLWEEESAKLPQPSPPTTFIEHEHKTTEELFTIPISILRQLNSNLQG
jgi:hypothetical protein